MACWTPSFPVATAVIGTILFVRLIVDVDVEESFDG